MFGRRERSDDNHTGARRSRIGPQPSDEVDTTGDTRQLQIGDDDVRSCRQRYRPRLVRPAVRQRQKTLVLQILDVQIALVHKAIDEQDASRVTLPHGIRRNAVSTSHLRHIRLHKTPLRPATFVAGEPTGHACGGDVSLTPRMGVLRGTRLEMGSGEEGSRGARIDHRTGSGPSGAQIT